MNYLSSFMQRTTAFLGLLGSLGIVAMMLHITLDIILRSTISVSIPATLELVTRYYMITLALLPLAWVEWRRGMISVEALSGLYGENGIRLIDIGVSILSTMIYAVLTLSTWEKAIEQYNIGSYVMSLNFPMPVWPTYFILPISFGLAALVSIVRTLLIIDGSEPKAGSLS